VKLNGYENFEEKNLEVSSVILLVICLPRSGEGEREMKIIMLVMGIVRKRIDFDEVQTIFMEIKVSKLFLLGIWLICPFADLSIGFSIIP
jgi:hypothetical protein